MIASHNTFTYLHPRKWWMRFLIPMVRCQTKSLKDQLINGVSLVDIRVTINNGVWYTCHGLYEIMTLDKTLKMIEASKINKVRILIENECSKLDLNVLSMILSEYPNIEFFEGRDKNTWEQKLELPSISYKLIQEVGSMKSFYGKICPWLYSIFNRKMLMNMYEEALKDNTIYYSFDFI